MEGHCSCNRLRYRVEKKPMVVHCCHCSWCQRETGSAFVINAVIETDAVKMLSGTSETIDTPSASGKGQKITRCNVCHVAVWSQYSGAGENIRFLRVGTLENPDKCPPDVHIYTSTRLDWVKLPDNASVVPEYYTPSEVWSDEAKLRWREATGRSR